MERRFVEQFEPTSLAKCCTQASMVTKVTACVFTREHCLPVSSAPSSVRCRCDGTLIRSDNGQRGELSLSCDTVYESVIHNQVQTSC